MGCYVIAQQSNEINEANRACSSSRNKFTICNGNGNDDCNSNGFYVRLIIYLNQFTFLI